MNPEMHKKSRFKESAFQFCFGWEIIPQLLW